MRIFRNSFSLAEVDIERHAAALTPNALSDRDRGAADPRVGAAAEAETAERLRAGAPRSTARDANRSMLITNGGGRGGGGRNVRKRTEAEAQRADRHTHSEPPTALERTALFSWPTTAVLSVHCAMRLVRSSQCVSTAPAGCGFSSIIGRPGRAGRRVAPPTRSPCHPCFACDPISGTAMTQQRCAPLKGRRLSLRCSSHLSFPFVFRLRAVLPPSSLFTHGFSCVRPRGAFGGVG